MAVTQITGGQIELVTPVQVTDNGDAPITESTEPPSTPSANGIPDVQPAETG
jgi:hypothetical protein